MQNKVKLLYVVKLDKLSFGFNNTNLDLANQVDEVIQKYYEDFIRNDAHSKFYRELTPTKQRRESYEGLNHNLQMIPLDLFHTFLTELRRVAKQDLKVYSYHLAKEIIVCYDTTEYINNILDHEYTNGYNAYTEEANSVNTAYISKEKDIDTSGKIKFKIKIYDKARQLMCKEGVTEIPLKEPVDEPGLPIVYIDGQMHLLLENLNMLRCEMELRENYLPYTTIDQMIEALENGSFQDTLEKHYEKLLKKSMFAEAQTKTSSASLKKIAINLMHKSNRNYKALFVNAGMSREYNYFKKAKETITREFDPLFNELREKLLNE